jgi:hypothetical protein
MNRTILAALVIAMWVPISARAQEPLTEHTVTLGAGNKPAPASIDDMRWLAGHWIGEALGGVVEEIWSPPRSGVMLCAYRLVRNGQPVFYEFITLAESNGTLVIRLKHFHPDLRGWEEKDRVFEFPFVQRTADSMQFEAMTFRRHGADRVTIFLAIKGKDGAFSEEAFEYHRAALAPVR